ncbi:unnamed protein product [Amoebophrya sp. A25]|nr:unnamed protein product [Amoebophrya sp. A25]|eukprot:GSA25T00000774001.1
MSRWKLCVRFLFCATTLVLGKSSSPSSNVGARNSEGRFVGFMGKTNRPSSGQAFVSGNEVVVPRNFHSTPQRDTTRELGGHVDAGITTAEMSDAVTGGNDTENSPAEALDESVGLVFSPTCSTATPRSMQGHSPAGGIGGRTPDGRVIQFFGKTKVVVPRLRGPSTCTQQSETSVAATTTMGTSDGDKQDHGGEDHVATSSTSSTYRDVAGGGLFLTTAGPPEQNLPLEMEGLEDPEGAGLELISSDPQEGEKTKGKKYVSVKHAEIGKFLHEASSVGLVMQALPKPVQTLLLVTLSYVTAMVLSGFALEDQWRAVEASSTINRDGKTTVIEGRGNAEQVPESELTRLKRGMLPHGEFCFDHAVSLSSSWHHLVELDEDDKKIQAFLDERATNKADFDGAVEILSSLAAGEVVETSTTATSSGGSQQQEQQNTARGPARKMNSNLLSKLSFTAAEDAVEKIREESWETFWRDIFPEDKVAAFFQRLTHEATRALETQASSTDSDKQKGEGSTSNTEKKERDLAKASLRMLRSLPWIFDQEKAGSMTARDWSEQIQPLWESYMDTLAKFSDRTIMDGQKKEEQRTMELKAEEHMMKDDADMSNSDSPEVEHAVDEEVDEVASLEKEFMKLKLTTSNEYRMMYFASLKELLKPFPDYLFCLLASNFGFGVYQGTNPIPEEVQVQIEESIRQLQNDPSFFGDVQATVLGRLWRNTELSQSRWLDSQIIQIHASKLEGIEGLQRQGPPAKQRRGTDTEALSRFVASKIYNTLKGMYENLRWPNYDPNRHDFDATFGDRYSVGSPQFQKELGRRAEEHAMEVYFNVVLPDLVRSWQHNSNVALSAAAWALRLPDSVSLGRCGSPLDLVRPRPSQFLDDGDVVKGMIDGKQLQLHGMQRFRPFSSNILSHWPTINSHFWFFKIYFYAYPDTTRMRRSPDDKDKPMLFAHDFLIGVENPQSPFDGRVFKYFGTYLMGLGQKNRAGIEVYDKENARDLLSLFRTPIEEHHSRAVSEHADEYQEHGGAEHIDLEVSGGQVKDGLFFRQANEENENRVLSFEEVALLELHQNDHENYRSSSHGERRQQALTVDERRLRDYEVRQTWKGKWNREFFKSEIPEQDLAVSGIGFPIIDSVYVMKKASPATASSAGTCSSASGTCTSSSGSGGK